MLRPALLLPVRGFHRVGLLTPGFTSPPLGFRCWSASGLSGDYPCGTFTRRNDAAWLGLSGRFRDPLRSAFTTHHEAILLRDVPPKPVARSSMTETRVARDSLERADPAVGARGALLLRRAAHAQAPAQHERTAALPSTVERGTVGAGDEPGDPDDTNQPGPE